MAEYPEVVLNELWAQLEDAKNAGHDSNDDYKDNVPVWLLRSAYEHLKRPEPRLYSFDEVIHLPADTMLWLEEVDEPDGAIIPTAYTGASFRGDPAEISDSDVIYVCFYGRIMNTCDGYNRYWRCWTAKPTDEQRKAVKWDDTCRR